MKRVFILAAVLLIALVLIAVFIVYSPRVDDKPFYVGVTFCGDTVAEAKLLIDKVKNYTNLFVLQSGPLQVNESAVVEIGDYAVANGLHFAAYFDTLSPPKQASWIGIAEHRWGNMFAGVYYGDEPGGKLLDSYVNLGESPVKNSNATNNGNGFNTTIGNPIIIKLANGGLQVGNTIYFPNGTIRVITSSGSFPDPSFWRDSFSGNADPAVFESNQTTTTITYFPNGTIIIEEIVVLATYFSNETTPVIRDRRDNLYTMENGTDRVSQVESYEEVLSRNPIPNCDAAAEKFVNRNQKILEGLNKQWSLNQSFPIFTSDYALYWWDYLSGYDVVLAQLGWNNTVAQEIGLVRGAANLQGKGWGVILTWKYTESPYLASGDEIYDQMRMSYECGAEYVIIFNYAEDMAGPYGTLQEEHFQALERFWNEVVQNPKVVHGGIKADAVLVLPRSYGWGMRNPDDMIWGLWNPNSTSQQIWALLQNKLAQHGSKLNIVYDDPAYPVARKYSQIYYWNQTS